jgi:hypothetical protein
MRKFNPTDMQDAVDFWEQGYDTLEIADYFGVPESFIYGALPRWRNAFASRFAKAA